MTASEGKRPHTQTVARVMNFLDEFGKEDVQMKKRRGKKFVVVDPTRPIVSLITAVVIERVVRPTWRV